MAISASPIPAPRTPAKEITFRTAGGELASFVVAVATPPLAARPAAFSSASRATQTFLARGDVRLPAVRSDWFVGFDLDVKRSEIKKVELTGGGRDGVTASRKRRQARRTRACRGAGEAHRRHFKVSRLATLVESFTFQDVRKATKPADDARRMAVDAGEGLRLVLTTVGDITEGWVQIAAEATSDAARDKAKLIASKVDGYDFRLPSNQAEILGWTVTDVTDEQKG